MIEKRYWVRFQCDDCGSVDYMPGIDWAREHGWAIARDRLHCYCPDCSPARRNLGCKGGRRYWLAKGASRSKMV